MLSLFIFLEAMPKEQYKITQKLFTRMSPVEPVVILSADFYEDEPEGIF